MKSVQERFTYHPTSPEAIRNLHGINKVAKGLTHLQDTPAEHAQEMGLPWPLAAALATGTEFLADPTDHMVGTGRGLLGVAEKDFGKAAREHALLHDIRHELGEREPIYADTGTANPGAPLPAAEHGTGRSQGLWPADQAEGLASHSPAQRPYGPQTQDDALAQAIRDLAEQRRREGTAVGQKNEGQFAREEQQALFDDSDMDPFYEDVIRGNRRADELDMAARGFGQHPPASYQQQPVPMSTERPVGQPLGPTTPGDTGAPLPERPPVPHEGGTFGHYPADEPPGFQAPPTIAPTEDTTGMVIGSRIPSHLRSLLRARRKIQYDDQLPPAQKLIDASVQGWPGGSEQPPTGE